MGGLRQVCVPRNRRGGGAGDLAFRSVVLGAAGLAQAASPPFPGSRRTLGRAPGPRLERNPSFPSGAAGSAQQVLIQLFKSRLPVPSLCAVLLVNFHVLEALGDGGVGEGRVVAQRAARTGGRLCPELRKLLKSTCNNEKERDSHMNKITFFGNQNIYNIRKGHTPFGNQCKMTKIRTWNAFLMPQHGHRLCPACSRGRG